MRPLRSTRPRILRLLAALPLVGLAALAGTPASAAAPGTTYRAVALGDSYAAGEGLAPYQDGTATGTDQCHRSDQAYPSLLQTSGVRRFRTLTSVACSGATTGGVVLGSRAEPSQLVALGRRTRTVTLTVGGNDIGFAAVLRDCVYSPLAVELVPGRPGCAARDDLPVRAATAYLAGVPGAPQPVPSALSMARLLTTIHAQAPRARIFVTGYPRIFGLSFSSPAGCQVGQLDEAGRVPLFVTEADARFIREKSDGLNAAIAAGVATARHQGVRARYVDVADAFTGHNVCSTGTPWVNGVLLTPGNPPTVASGSFHPTARGQRAYADAVAAAAGGRSRS
jgi:lysophospholipase L1-like esterase